MTPSNYVNRFSELVRKVLESRGYVFEPEADFGRRRGFDFVVTSPEGGNIGVEVKFYRSHRVAHSLLFHAISQLSDTLNHSHFKRAFLVCSLELPRMWTRTFALSDIWIEVIDLPKLMEMARNLPDVAEGIQELLRISRMEAASSFEQSAQERQPEEEKSVDAGGPDPLRQFAPFFQRDLKAVDGLIERLTHCPSSKKGATDYERICEDVLKELFGDDLGEFKRQHSIADGFHRPDLIVSIKPQNDFWTNLRNDFRSRYVVFEIKNYRNKISQEQIYSTEKYLFNTALRSIAIIVARNSEDAGAKSARQGALRENGKLILTVSQAELIQMLKMKQQGEECTHYMAEKLDDMLTTLAR